MQTKKERIKELERDKLDLSRRLYSKNRQLEYTEKVVRDRNEKIVELQKQLEEKGDELQFMKERQERVLSSLCDYVSFYESLNTLVEGFAERRAVCDKDVDKAPKIFTIDLTEDTPEVPTVCDFINDIIACLLGDEDE